MNKPILITEHEQRIAELELQVKTQAESIEELVTNIEQLQKDLQTWKNIANIHADLVVKLTEDKKS